MRSQIAGKGGNTAEVDSDGSLLVKLIGDYLVNNKIQVDVGGATFTGTIGDMQAKVLAVTLQDVVSAPGVGTAFDVAAYKTLTLEISGTSTSQTINFEGSGVSGTFYPIQGTKLLDFSMATQTTGNGELWQFDVTGLNQFRANLTAVAGGNVSVKGKAVAA